MFRAIDFCQRAEKIPHLRRVHEFIVIIVRTVTRPDLSARLDIARGDENKIGVLAELVDRGVLKMGFDAIDLAWGKINSADVAAEIFAIEKFVRLGFVPCAFGNRRQIVIAAGIFLGFQQPAAQLSNHLPFLNFNGGKQPVACTRYRRSLYHRAFVQVLIDLEHWNEFYRALVGPQFRAEEETKYRGNCDDKGPLMLHALCCVWFR